MPLWLAIAVGDVFRLTRGTAMDGVMKWSLLGLAIGTVFSLGILWFAFCDRRIEPTPVEVVEAKEGKTASAEVLLTYVLPLWAFDFTDGMGWAQFGLFFVVVVWLACRHLILEGCLFLELIGYRVYQCKLLENGIDEKPHEYWVFSKEPLEALPNPTRNMVPLSNQARLLLRGGK